MHSRSMDFEYCPTSVAGPGCDSSWHENLGGCECEQECSAEQKCSCLLSAEDNYSREGLLTNRTSGAPLLECHDGCACSWRDGACRNRIVQRGVKAKLKVRRTEDGKGHGVLAIEPLVAGRFICEYAGEIIGAEEVERRAVWKHEHNYTLTIKEHSQSGTKCFFIDPRFRGNLARFINHSCEPNLTLCPVRIGRPVPVIGLFASRDIAAGEELCYDYGPSGSAVGSQSKRCLCGAVSCRGYLPTSKTASE